MSTNWMDDFFGKAKARPDHPDFAALSEVLLRMDSGIDPVNNSQEENERQWKARMEELGIDTEVASYASIQRAMRAAGVKNEAEMMEKFGQVLILSSVWLDGLAAGAFYERKTSEDECPFDCDACRED